MVIVYVINKKLSVLGEKAVHYKYLGGSSIMVLRSFGISTRMENIK